MIFQLQHSQYVYQLASGILLVSISFRWVVGLGMQFQVENNFLQNSEETAPLSESISMSTHVTMEKSDVILTPVPWCMTRSPSLPTPGSSQNLFVFDVQILYNNVPGITIFFVFFSGGLTPPVFYLPTPIRIGCCLGQLYKCCLIPSLFCEYWILHFPTSKSLFWFTPSFY